MDILTFIAGLAVGSVLTQIFIMPKVRACIAARREAKQAA